MKYTIIDIGTNTIRSVIYNEELQREEDLVCESTILRHTDNGRLTDEGVFELCDSLQKAIEFSKVNNAERILCFATSAMRDVCNFDDVNRTVCDKFGFEIELLSEREEAMCDFSTIKLQLGEDIGGAGTDLGGGSCQILVFEDGRLLYYCSRKLGVKRLYNTFGELKRKNEREVTEYIKSSIADVQIRKSETLYVMGGTSKKIKKLATNIFGTEDITVQILSDIIEEYYFDEPEYKELAGKEQYKIPYGALVLRELCRIFKAERIVVMKGGVRDGYVRSRLS